MDKLICGTIVGTHGIKGEVKVYLKTDFVEDRFKVGSELSLNNNKVLKVESTRFHKKFLLVKFEGYPNINDVLAFKGMDLYADISDDDHDGVFYFELVGMKVVSEEGQLIGTVDSILETAAHDILVIKSDNNRKVMIPYVDAFIVKEDVENKVLTIRVIEGLINEI